MRSRAIVDQPRSVVLGHASAEPSNTDSLHAGNGVHLATSLTHEPSLAPSDDVGAEGGGSSPGSAVRAYERAGAVLLLLKPGFSSASPEPPGLCDLM